MRPPDPSIAMETIAHRQLKRLARQFLRNLGCAAFAEEVRCPISRYRVDVAGWLDRQPGARQRALWAEAPCLQSLYEPLDETKRWWRCRPRTVMIECKQSRADFLRDSRHLERLVALRDDLQRIRGSIEEHRIKQAEPHLRRNGTSLFPDLDDWDFHASRLPAYRAIMRKLRRAEAQLYGQTKFHMIARYKLADRLFIAAPKGMIRPGELPVGWGLLECPAECLERDFDDATLFDRPPRLTVRIDAAERLAPEKFRDRLLRNIAAAATVAATEREQRTSFII